MNFATDVYAIFSTGNTTDQIRARTNFDTTGETFFTVPGISPGTPHLYRIEWDAGEVRYYVDGVLKVTHTGSFGSTCGQPSATAAPAAPSSRSDWLRMSPYPASGTFDSRVFDAGQTADWGALSWNSATPSGTGIAISVRTGNSPIPDETWSAFTPMTSGGDIPHSSRYVQYRAELSSTDPGRTPTLTDVSISY